MRSVKKHIPVPAKLALRRIIKFFKYRYRRVKIMKPVANGERIKIIVGAAETTQPGWYSTNENWLDVTRRDHWDRVFKGKRIVTHVVAEHVFEHLTREECLTALSNIRDHLVDGGHVRIAVPDGYHPDPDYLRHVGIEGIGADAADHKQLLNVDELTELFVQSGFIATQLEGYRRDGELVQTPHEAADGRIHRSRQHVTDQMRQGWSFVDADTSLIVDGVKA